MKLKSDHVLTFATIVALAAAVAPQLSATGWARTRIREKVTASEERKKIADVLPALLNAPSRLDTTAAKQRLALFSDYECPFCRKAETQVQQLIEDGSVGITFHHYPLTGIHPAAAGAARTAICAESSGHFPAVHAILMRETEWMKTKDWSAVAHKAGITDLEAFSRCLNSDETTDRLKQDALLASKLGITGTPTFVGPNGKVTGARSFEELKQLATR